MSTTADLVAALGAAGVADVGASDLDRALHAADASLYRVLPLVVVRPRHTDELEAVLSVARASGTPLTMRGAGTSIAGNAVGPGIVVDTSRHLTRIRELDVESGTAVVEPGVVHAALQARATAAGWRFGPDPSTHTRCTVGGMVGNNACGSRALGYGRTSDNVEALDVLWGSGQRQRLAPGVSDGLAGDLAALVAGDLAHARTHFGQFSRQVSGYALEHLLPERLRPERFVVGSEGTLAVVETATVRLVRDAPVRHLVVLGYGSMVEAADAVPGLLGVDGLVACEGLDERIVRLVSSPPPLPRGTGWLFAEVTGEEAGEAGARARAVVAAAGALEAMVVTDPALQALLWRIREDGAGLAARSLARPAHSGWEDAAVPPEKLGAWLRDFDALLRAHDLDGVPYGHFGDGCVHVRIDFDFSDGGARFKGFLRECASALASYGGSLSGEHGDGRARSELLPLMYDARSLELFAAAKALADPDGLLNPGVLVDPAPLDADLRPARPVRQVSGLRLVADLGAEAHRCTGVGKCVSAHSPGVMCPSWQATREEKDSTRGRARVLQEALDADGTLTGLDDDAVAEVLDLCLSCKACATDCPTGVDMATLKSEVLHQRHAGPLGWVRRPRTHHTLGRLPMLLDSPARRLLPLAAGDGVLARLAKRVAGVDARRSLPTPPPDRLRGSGVAPADAAGVAPDVWIWADTFTDHFAPDAARAAARVLEGAGLRAEVIGARGCCGLTYVSTGQLDAARRSVDGLVAALGPYVATGAPVLGLEPSCLATLRSDALRLASDPAAARRVAGAAVTLAELLTRHDVAVPDLTGTTVVVQPHCHQYAVVGFAPDEALLRRTGATVVKVSGCCGLAGNFGVEAGHHEVSVAVAETHLLPTLRAHPDAVVLADGMSCRTQVEDLAGREVITLAALLAGDHRRP
ncbi:FAD-binding and (Fe-S)-binding domain-containing protein [Nocardioides jishulii]|uniref:FAD-binding oxidoreductase n=1 Tax=Nocardioides jishulii TaxID=2575440 RepID=A0A4U2YUT2_9ACTN|nr:FAD-binding and (Fe-S)-binding domain-containing protein [Nocardioides jishulii]QCX28615.1 FAD-binding oxidoreductase [Nocardioides jishulii]TKI64492.1 FAD-binding oxidoreductase [Nocardioides jishulii]